MTEDEHTQAEIAGRIFKTAETLPMKGQLIRDFEFTSADGRKVTLSDYRGRTNLVLVFAGGGPRSLEALSGIAKSYKKIQAEEAEVLVVLQCSSERASRVREEACAEFPVLIDADGRIHRLRAPQMKAGSRQLRSISQIDSAKCLPRSRNQKSKPCPK